MASAPLAVVAVAGIGIGLMAASNAATIIVGTLQGESMTEAAGNVRVVSDSTGTSMKFISKGASAASSISAAQPVTGIRIRAKGDQCNGAPRLRVVVDGTQVMLTSITSTSFKAYDANFETTAGSHNVSVTLTNFASTTTCKRFAYLDLIRVMGVTSTDTTPPSVSVSNPQSNASVSGTVNVAAAASDNTAIAKVEFYIDSALVGTDIETPYTYDWNTTTAANSSHALTARAYDSAGNIGTSAAVNVAVNNTTTTPTPTPPTPPPTPSTVGLPYGLSYFTKALPGNAPVDATRTTSFHNFMKTQVQQKAITWPKINMNENWAMSYHVGTAADPIWKLAGGNTSDPKLKILQTQGFHMADSVADTFPSGIQDRPGVMIDNVFGYTVQFADAVPNKATRTITVSNAGIMWHSSNGLDYRNPKSNDQRNFTSRGRILDAMVIRRDILDRAVANNTGLGHVLHIFFVETNSAEGFSHPMSGAESAKAGWGAEGDRIRIKPSVDLSARGLSGACLAVARTLQQNGGYLGDNSGSSTQLKAAQPQFYVGTNLSTDCMQGKVNWDDFDVIQRGYEP